MCLYVNCLLCVKRKKEKTRFLKAKEREKKRIEKRDKNLLSRRKESEKRKRTKRDVSLYLYTHTLRTE